MENLSREKQIEEMSTEIREAVNGCSSYWSGLIAEHLYEQGYRKQKEGEWYKDGNGRTCSQCGYKYWAKDTVFNYCPNCATKMKGGEGE